MSIFHKRQRAQAPAAAATTLRTAPLPARRAEHGPAAPLPDQALRRIHAAADEARKEIAALVQAEREAIGKAIESVSGDAEERLRGATEKRIDREMKRVEAAGNKLSRDLRRMIRMEMAKVARASGARDDGDGDRSPSVPIRARA